MSERRERLLRLIASIDQQVAEAAALTEEATDDEVLQGAANHLAQLRQMLKDVEAKLKADETA